ncbi:MAG: HAD family phosphatase [Tepidisphaeraceae bacterium]
MPGVVEFVRQFQKHCPLAICSGALRVEIEAMLRVVGLLDAFDILITGGDVLVGKPDPMGYLETVRQLNAKHGLDLTPGDCLIVEDAPKVARNARSVGFSVLGVTTSQPVENWGEVEWLAKSLRAADLGEAGFSAIGMVKKATRPLR